MLKTPALGSFRQPQGRTLGCCDFPTVSGSNKLTPQRVFDALGELAGERLYTTPS
jgi:hypothetical protein